MMKQRRMEACHLEQVERIERKCFSDPWSMGMLQEEWESSCTHAFVAEAEGQILAFAFIKQVLDEAELLQIAVSPCERGRGIGKMLLSYAMEQMAGLRTIFLEVRSQNAPAIGLYQALGFQKIACRKGYYNHPEDDAFIYQLQRE